MLFAIVVLAVVCVAMSLWVVRLRSEVRSASKLIDKMFEDAATQRRAVVKWTGKYFQMRKVATRMRDAFDEINRAAYRAADNLEQKIDGIINGLPAIPNVMESKENANETDD